MLVSSENSTVAAVNSHVSIQIARLTESQQTQFALIGFFAAEIIHRKNFPPKNSFDKYFTCEFLNVS